jgi:hypothetical protein
MLGGDMLHVGMNVEIIKAYDMETGRRSRVDEVAHYCGTIVDLAPSGDVLVELRNGDEVWINWRRLRRD